MGETRVNGILRPKSLDDLQAAVRQARRRDKPISIAGSVGGYHAEFWPQRGAESAREEILLGVDRLSVYLQLVDL